MESLNTNKFLTLKEYDNISIGLLKRNGLVVTDNNISSINEMMMKADMKYQDGITNYGRNKFRIFYAVYAVRTLKKNYYNLKKKQKNEEKFYSLYDKLKNKDLFLFDEIKDNNIYNIVESKDVLKKIKDSKMTEKEKLICEKIMFDFQSLVYSDTAKNLGITKQDLEICLKRMKIKYPWLLEILV
jgi:hypothetical protein